MAKKMSNKRFRQMMKDLNKRNTGETPKKDAA